MSKSLKIYEYTNYRTYLQDFYLLNKEAKRNFSYRFFSKKAGFKSPNFLKLIIDGKRNLTMDSCKKISKALDLTDNQSEFFITMVHMNQASTDAEKEDCYIKMMKMIPSVSRKSLGLEAHKYLSHWLYPVLREMIELDDFKEDPYWIARKLNFDVNVSQIKSVMSFLKKEGFVYYNSAKKLVPKDKILESPDEISSLSYRNYHRQMLQQAIESLEALSLEEREFGALTFVLPGSSVSELKKKIKEFRKSLHIWAVEESEKKSSDTVIQVNMQAYSHTKIMKSET